MHGCELQTRGTVCPVEETAGASAWERDTAWCFFSSAVQRKGKGFWTMGVSGTDVEEGVSIIFKHSGNCLCGIHGDALAGQPLASVWERKEEPERPTFFFKYFLFF